MKSLKKVLTLVLISTSINTILSTSVSASTNIPPKTEHTNNPEYFNSPKIKLPSSIPLCCNKPGHAVMKFNRYETGKVTVTSNSPTSHPIWDINALHTGLYYYRNESFYYDSVYSFYECRNDRTLNFASYVSHTTGERRFVMTSITLSNGQKERIDGLLIE